MTTTSRPAQTNLGERDLQLPGHRQVAQRPLPAPLRIIGAACGALGMALIAIVYVVGAPVIALTTGIGQILSEVRENAARPRPFVGARHGFPFLDPPPLHTEIARDTTEE